MGDCGQQHPRIRNPVPIVQAAGWFPGPVWRVAENLPPTDIRSLDRPASSDTLQTELSRPTYVYV